MLSPRNTLQFQVYSREVAAELLFPSNLKSMSLRIPPILLYCYRKRDITGPMFPVPLLLFAWHTGPRDPTELLSGFCIGALAGSSTTSAEERA